MHIWTSNMEIWKYGNFIKKIDCKYGQHEPAHLLKIFQNFQKKKLKLQMLVDGHICWLTKTCADPPTHAHTQHITTNTDTQTHTHTSFFTNTHKWFFGRTSVMDIRAKKINIMEDEQRTSITTKWQYPNPSRRLPEKKVYKHNIVFFSKNIWMIPTNIIFFFNGLSVQHALQKKRQGILPTTKMVPVVKTLFSRAMK